LFSKSHYSKDKISLTLSCAAGEELLKNIALLLQSNLGQLGIELKIEVYPWSVQWARAKNLETAPNIFLFYWWPTYPTPYDPLLNLFHTESEPVYNLSFYSNAQFDSLIAEGNRITGMNRRAAIKYFQNAQSILFKDVPALFIADLHRVYVARKRIHAFVPNAAYPNVVFFYNLVVE
jgi:peptide/nickel transport system substrate-binding protein